jgi:hypothetical protein
MKDTCENESSSIGELHLMSLCAGRGVFAIFLWSTRLSKLKNVTQYLLRDVNETGGTNGDHSYPKYIYIYIFISTTLVPQNGGDYFPNNMWCFLFHEFLRKKEVQGTHHMITINPSTKTI